MTASVVTHIMTLASFVAFILYLHGTAPQQWLNRTIERPLAAALIDVGLIVLFALQHTGMASLRFKARSRRFVPAALERTVYCAATSVTLLLLVLGWAPFPDVLFDVRDDTWRVVIQTLFWSVWGLFFLSLLTDSYLEFFGLRQAWCYATGRTFTMASFRTDGLYRFARHPSLTLIILGLWLTPVMTVGRLMLTVLLTAYTVVGAWSVDRKYVFYYGDPYVRRQQQVPLLVPRLMRRSQRSSHQHRPPGSELDE